MLFMIIERFKDRDPFPIYARLREQGRSMPDGLRYVDSWVEANFNRCFQLMECEDPLLLQQWILQWRDLIDYLGGLPGNAPDRQIGLNWRFFRSRALTCCHPLIRR